MVSNIKIEIWGFNLSDILFVNYDWTCDDGDDDDDDDGVDDDQYVIQGVIWNKTGKQKMAN